MIFQGEKNELINLRKKERYKNGSFDIMYPWKS